MTKEEAIKFLSNKKVFVKDKGKEVQDKLFELGYRWASKRTDEYKSTPFIYISTPNNPLDFSGFDKNNIDYFYNRHSFKEISVEDILNIKIEKSLPKTWEEYSKQTGKRYWEYDSETQYQYEVHKKLLHLRDCYRNGWEPKDCELRWIITPIGSGFYIGRYYNINRFLSFQSEEIAEEFLKNFKNLIIQAGDFI